jgi:hypothetical protein
MVNIFGTNLVTLSRSDLLHNHYATQHNIDRFQTKRAQTSTSTKRRTIDNGRMMTGTPIQVDATTSEATSARRRQDRSFESKPVAPRNYHRRQCHTIMMRTASPAVPTLVAVVVGVVIVLSSQKTMAAPPLPAVDVVALAFIPATLQQPMALRPKKTTMTPRERTPRGGDRFARFVALCMGKGGSAGGAGGGNKGKRCRFLQQAHSIPPSTATSTALPQSPLRRRCR